MNMETTVEHNPAYALVRAAGSPTLDEMLAVIEAIGLESQAWPQGAVLVDLRQVATLASFTEQYRLGELAVRAFSHLSKLASLVPFKVKIDSDIPIAEVALACAGQRKTDSVGASDTIASFQVPAGSCTITLTGNVDMEASVEVPATGGDTRCVVRGGRVTCG